MLYISSPVIEYNNSNESLSNTSSQEVAETGSKTVVASKPQSVVPILVNVTTVLYVFLMFVNT